MFINLAKGALWYLIALYDTELDALLVRKQDEFQTGGAPEYWQPHPSNPNVLVGYVRDTYEERDGYEEPVILVPYDRSVALKLLRASIEPPWDHTACEHLHQMGFGFHDGIPCVSQVNELWHVREALSKWFEDKQLKLFGEMAEW